MEVPSGLVVVAARCLRPGAEEGWASWVVGELAAAVGEVAGAGATTLWALAERPVPGLPGPGFSHVILHDLHGPDPAGVASAIEGRLLEAAAGGDLHPDHVVVALEAWRAHGPWAAPLVPASSASGMILAEVLCTDTRRLDEWDRWYDGEHVPDMLATGAFAAASRWARVRPRSFGPNHLTRYDVTLPEVQDAVARSAAAMPALVAAGRKHPCHTGGSTLLVEAVRPLTDEATDG